MTTYRGFEIDTEMDYLGYRVYLNGRIIYTACTECDAYDWIDRQVRQAKRYYALSLGEAH